MLGKVLYRQMESVQSPGYKVLRATTNDSNHTCTLAADLGATILEQAASHAASDIPELPSASNGISGFNSPDPRGTRLPWQRGDGGSQEVNGPTDSWVECVNFCSGRSRADQLASTGSREADPRPGSASGWGWGVVAGAANEAFGSGRLWIFSPRGDDRNIFFPGFRFPNPFPSDPDQG